MKNNPSGEGFLQLYISILLTLMVLALLAILALMLYAGVSVKQQAKTIGHKVDNFNSEVKKINNNLQTIDQQLSNAKSLSKLRTY